MNPSIIKQISQLSIIDNKPQKVSRLLKDRNPELFAQAYPEDNPDIDLNKITRCSNKKLTWTCPNGKKCGHPHKWEATPNNRSRNGTGCPFCSKTPQRFCPCNSFAALRPDLLADWDYEKNNAAGIFPDKIALHSDVEVSWTCHKKTECGCPHEWKVRLYSRTTNRNGCPFCSIPAHQICEHMSFAHKHADLLPQWHYEKNDAAGIFPDKVAPQSHTKAWWVCTAPCGCVHEWETTVCNRVNGRGCSFCSNPAKKSCIHTAMRPKLIIS